MTKVCAKCRVEKDGSDFYDKRRGKDGKQGYCIQCKVQIGKKRYIEKKHEIGLNYINNREMFREQRRIYTKNNPEKVRETRRKSQQKRLRECPSVRLNFNVAKALRASLKSRGLEKNRSKTYDIIGYSSEQLVAHLESQFEPWMNWSNYGGATNDPRMTWHIDHIIPQSSFNFDSKHHPELKKCWALSNLRPLEKIANMMKGKKICVSESSVSASLGKPVSSVSNSSVTPLVSTTSLSAPAYVNSQMPKWYSCASRRHQMKTALAIPQS